MMETSNKLTAPVLVDLQAGLHRVRGNRRLYCNMLKLFLQHEELQKLAQALEHDDCPAAAAAAHSVKGMAGNLSLMALFHMAAEVQKQCMAGQLQPHVAQDYHDVMIATQDAVRQVISQLEKEEAANPGA